MNGTSAGPAIAALLVAILLGSPQDSWKPYQFSPGERYEFRIVDVASGPRKKDVERHYTVEIQPTDQKDEDGEPLFEISYTTRGMARNKDISQKAVFGMFEAPGSGLLWAMTTAYTPFFRNLTLKEGETISVKHPTTMEPATIKITGREKIAGRDGFACQYFTRKGDSEVLAQEWVIDPTLAMPLKLTLHEKGRVKLRMEMVKCGKE